MRVDVSFASHRAACCCAIWACLSTLYVYARGHVWSVTFALVRDTRSRWPYLGNAFKYAFAQSIILFGVFKPHLRSPVDSARITPYQVIWILAFICSTLYSFWWDVVMDWGLGNPDSGFLRDRLLFRRRWIYWLVSPRSA